MSSVSRMETSNVVDLMNTLNEQILTQSTNMEVDLKTTIKFWFGGLVYGLGLTGIGVLMAGAGHGTYLLLGIASAPLNFLGVGFSIITPPLMWSTLCGLLAYHRRNPQRQILRFAFAIHYLSITLLPFSEEYADKGYFFKALEANSLVVILGFAFYLTGQAMIWFYWFRAEADTKLS